MTSSFLAQHSFPDPRSLISLSLAFTWAETLDLFRGISRWPIRAGNFLKVLCVGQIILGLWKFCLLWGLTKYGWGLTCKDSRYPVHYIGKIVWMFKFLGVFLSGVGASAKLFGNYIDQYTSNITHEKNYTSHMTHDTFTETWRPGEFNRVITIYMMHHTSHIPSFDNTLCIT